MSNSEYDSLYISDSVSSRSRLIDENKLIVRTIQTSHKLAAKITLFEFLNNSIFKKYISFVYIFDTDEVIFQL